METIGTWWMWVGFFALVLVMLAIDLFVVGDGASTEAAGAPGLDVAWTVTVTPAP